MFAEELTILFVSNIIVFAALCTLLLAWFICYLIINLSQSEHSSSPHPLPCTSTAFSNHSLSSSTYKSTPLSFHSSHSISLLIILSSSQHPLSFFIIIIIIVLLLSSFSHPPHIILLSFFHSLFFFHRSSFCHCPNSTLSATSILSPPLLLIFLLLLLFPPLILFVF